MNSLPADWELDYYSRPLQDANGKKRWELLLNSSNNSFRWQRFCPAESVNSQWLNQALSDAIREAKAEGIEIAPRLRCWRPSMRTMVQRAAEPLGLEVIGSRRCYGLIEWIQEREAAVYPAMEGFLVGPLAPPPSPLKPLAATPRRRALQTRIQAQALASNAPGAAGQGGHACSSTLYE